MAKRLQDINMFVFRRMTEAYKKIKEGMIALLGFIAGWFSSKL